MSKPRKFSMAQAAADLPTYKPPRGIPGPAMHEVTLGTTPVAFVSDGAMSLPTRVLAPEAPDQALREVLGVTQMPRFIRGDLTMALIRRGDALVLVDAGAGPGWQGGTGRLVRHLAANGIDPGAVTDLVLTHLHPDHAWGAVAADGAPVFANARVHVGAREAAFWQQPGLADRMAPQARDAVAGAVRVLRAYGDRIVPVRDGDAPVPGLIVMDTPGHSPGHISLLLQDGPGLVLTGDAVVNQTVSFARPDWHFGFDMDRPAAAATRRRVLSLASDRGHAIAGCHWRWPGIGRAVRRGDAFAFLAD